MAVNLDPETSHKLDMINHKIDEINQRRTGIHMTKIEDDLDRQELDDYIKSLHLTADQKKIVDGFSQHNDRYVQGQSSMYFVMMFISMLVEVYLGFMIYDQLLAPKLDTLDTLILYVLIAVFLVNLVYMARYLKILR
jgi:antibiotic biosynthesis monooxygenase (ABM) superfamily enzyme